MYCIAMSAPHRINIVAPTRAKIKEVKAEANKRGLNVSKFFWHCYETVTNAAK